MWVPALFIIPVYGHPTCPTLDERIRKTQKIYIMDTIMSLSGKWMEVEIMSSEILKSQKNKYCVLFNMQSLDIFPLKT